MRQLVLKIISSLALLVLSGTAKAEWRIPWGYIVVFEDDVDVDETCEDLRQRFRISPGYVYRHVIKGMYVSGLPVSMELWQPVLADRRVKSVTPNYIVLDSSPPVPLDAEIKVIKVDPRREQVSSNGFKRIGGETAYNVRSGVTVDANIAIIDTGIDPRHPDLNVDKEHSIGFYSLFGSLHASENSFFWTDRLSHGTHVAGIAAAKDNGIGIIGAAPGARVASIRVTEDLWGSSKPSTASLIAAFDYVGEHADYFDVANCSLNITEGPNTNTVIRLAARKLVEMGVVLCVSAGNGELNKDETAFDLSTVRNVKETSPAGEPSLITVSALADSDGKPGNEGSATKIKTKGKKGDIYIDAGPDDSFAIFSFYGECVDIAAPGVNILSTVPGGKYDYQSGTSQAAPFVTGAAAKYIAENRSTNPTPAQVKQALLDAAWRQGDSHYFTPCSPPGVNPEDDDGFPEPLLSLVPMRITRLAIGRSGQLSVSGDGTVVAGNWGSSGFRWTAATGKQELGFLPGTNITTVRAISSDGNVIVGRASSGGAEYYPFRWTQSAGMQSLQLPHYGPPAGGSDPFNYEFGESTGVSADGSVIAGFVSSGYGGTHALRWNTAGEAERLHEFTGDYVVTSEATQVSANAENIVGAAYKWNLSVSFPQEPVRWKGSRGIEGLGLLPGAEYGTATDISADGSVIVGYMQYPSSVRKAFRWTVPLGMQSLSELPGIPLNSSTVANAVSDDGTVIVGFSGPRAYIWDSTNGMRDLFDILENAGVNLDEWDPARSSLATGVSANGQFIVGFAASNPTGIDDGWIIDLGKPPVPPLKPSKSAAIDTKNGGDAENGVPGARVRRRQVP